MVNGRLVRCKMLLCMSDRAGYWQTDFSTFCISISKYKTSFYEKTCLPDRALDILPTIRCLVRHPCPYLGLGGTKEFPKSQQSMQWKWEQQNKHMELSNGPNFLMLASCMLVFLYASGLSNT